VARYFTLQEAEALLPSIAQSVREAQNVREQFQQAELNLQGHKRQVVLTGGMIVNLNRIFALRDQRDNALKRLKNAVAAITDCGCQLKDLDMGLVDFPTLYEGDEVLLCWKLGEDQIRFWHGTNEGYAGRKEIDDHFREYHQGGNDEVPE
jgi:hypothetical protein